MNDTNMKPSWAPRVSRRKIWQLYQNDAKGIRDEVLVDDVGIGLLLRVESCLTVSEAQRGNVKCPKCSSIIERYRRRRRKHEIEVLKCSSCGWELPWPEYRKTFHNKHLGCAGMLVPCQEFARDYPRAKTYREKIILIDTLIHRFHWQMEGNPAQPGATVIIGGKMSEIADFLDGLTYGDQNTPGLKERLEEWREIAKDKAYGPSRTRRKGGSAEAASRHPKGHT